MIDDQLYNGIENYGFGKLPETMEDLVEALEILDAEIEEISDQLKMPEAFGDQAWIRSAMGARSIKSKQRAILRGHRVWMAKEDKISETQAKLTAVLRHLYANHHDAHREAIALCKRLDAGFKE